MEVIIRDKCKKCGEEIDKFHFNTHIDYNLNSRYSIKGSITATSYAKCICHKCNEENKIILSVLTENL